MRPRIRSPTPQTVQREIPHKEYQGIRSGCWGNYVIIQFFSTFLVFQGCLSKFAIPFSALLA